ncbi:MAG TPA: hypothetical protein VMF59_07935 [Bacteroidota bacterium]|nr:hypothetical protein [Bacteroidota bacterium]
MSSFVRFVILAAALSAVRPGHSPGQERFHGGAGTLAVPAFPAAFPLSDYTPFGYIDNPAHSMIANRSGVVRSVPPLGFGWWKTSFKGGYGDANRDHQDYYAFLQMSVEVGGNLYADAEDFPRHGARLSSSYHTAHAMSYDWRDSSVSVRLLYFLPRENTIACCAVFENTGAVPRSVTVTATSVYGIGPTEWWGSDGLTARALPGEDLTVSKIWAYGDVVAAGSTVRPLAHLCTASVDEWKRWVRHPDTVSAGFATLRGRGPVRAAQAYTFTLPPGAHRAELFCMSRGKNEAGAVREFSESIAGSLPALARRMEEDGRFWSLCPVLEGDWPEAWKHGWVYDFETLRMNVRRPTGIFHHPWDAMQVHAPRAVLGETSLDMMTLGYADPVLAREVIRGTFEDALAPNVPCAREDGSMNMISSDGSECGTAPMWGYPFRTIRSIFASTGDTAWVAALYPYLRSYVDWWLANRTDREGWLHCNNSWESGQDGSRRFLVAESNEGAVADFVRTVDVEASMADAMETLREFAPLAGHPEDAGRWAGLARERRAHVHGMFFDGWFRDIDGRSGKPIMLKDYYDVMMLSPLACNVASPAEVLAVSANLDLFVGKMARWLQWPPGLQTFAEAAWNAGKRMTASAAVAAAAGRVYARTDSRSVTSGDPADPFSIRIPGVANEFWPDEDIPPGGENYGWGATLPMHIIRAIIGFHEDPAGNGFILAPAIPEGLFLTGNTYTVDRLHFRGETYRVSCTCTGVDSLLVTLKAESGRPLEVRGSSGLLLSGPGGSFHVTNGDLLIVAPGRGRER